MARRKKTSPIVRRPREPLIESEESSAVEDSDPEDAPSLPRLAPTKTRVTHRTYYGHWSSSSDEDDEDDDDFTE